MKDLSAGEDILTHNARLYTVGEFLRCFQLWIPIWVAYELRYISIGQLPVLEAVSNGMQLVLELPTGAFADIVGKRISMFFGICIMAVAILIYASARTFPQFLVYAVVFGIGGSLFSGASEAFIYDSAKEANREKDFAKVYAKIGMYSQIALAVATLVGGVISLWSFDLPLYLTFASVCLAAVVTLFYREPKIDTKKFSLTGYAVQMKNGVAELFHTKSAKIMSLFYIGVGGISWVCNLLFNTTMLTTLGHSTLEIGIFYFIIRILNGVLLFKVLHIDNFLTKQRAALLFPLIMAIGLLPGIFLAKWWVMGAVWLMLFASTGRWVVLSQYTNAEFSSKNRATALSALSMMIGLIYVAVALISGPVMQAYGGPGIMYSALGILTLLVVLPLGLKIRASTGHS